MADPVRPRTRLQEKYPEAIAVLDSLTPSGHEASARVQLERGRVLCSRGDQDQARPHFEQAATIAEAGGIDALLIDALHMQALVAPAADQKAINEHALEVARSSADESARDWDASLLNNIGMNYADDGDFNAALDVFGQAVAAREHIGAAAETRVARWMVGWSLRKLNRRDEALIMQTALKAELDALGSTDPYVDEELDLLAE
ncbi:tetratricopeptide repeat protein [Dermatophilaceae bacterium Sec6.4]